MILKFDSVILNYPKLSVLAGFNCLLLHLNCIPVDRCFS